MSNVQLNLAFYKLLNSVDRWSAGNTYFLLNGEAKDGILKKNLNKKYYRANTRNWLYTDSNNKTYSYTTFPHCDYPANPNETPSTTFTREHNTVSWTKHMHWNSSWAHVNNQTTFLLGAFDKNSRKWVSNVNLECKITPRIRNSLPSQTEHQQEWGHHDWEQWSENG